MLLSAFSLEGIGRRGLPEVRRIVLPVPINGIPVAGLVCGAVFSTDAAADIFIECSQGRDCGDEVDRIDRFALEHAEELSGLSAADAAALYFTRKDNGR